MVEGFKGRLAYNPLPWMYRGGRYERTAMPPLPEVLAKIKRAGFHAVQADVPDGMDVDHFRAELDRAGVAPAPAYFSAPFSELVSFELTLERAALKAAEQAQLGLRDIVIADVVNSTRAQRPGRAADASQDRMQRIIQQVRSVAEVMVAEGVTPALHPHVGTWIEAGDEADAILSAVGGDLLHLCPDNIHLLWAGTDPLQYAARHSVRVSVAHLKDLHLKVWRSARHAGLSLRELQAGHVITEPGRGDADIEGFLTALGPRFNGWVVVEVDVADLPSADESVVAAAAWAANSLPREAIGPFVSV